MPTPSRRSATVLATLALFAGLMVPGAVAQPTDCGAILRTTQLQTMLDAGPVIGEGLTVVRGIEPTPFTVEVLGVLEDGVALGRDMIIVEVQGDAIEDAGGIWQGMSGSPVYVDDQLIGAVAYGLSFVSTAIGGLTPAQDLVRLVDLPDSDPRSFAGADEDADLRGDRDIVADGALAAEVTRRVDAAGGPAFAQSRAGYANRDGSVNFRRLAVPMAVSGLTDARLDVLQTAMQRAGYAVNVHSSGSADFSQLSTTTDLPVPGGNMAVADALGDVTAAAVGTATLVCDGKIVGFGHPFGFSGETLSAATTATAITIVPDPGFAPFKLANIGDVFGTVDQDRLAGIRGRNGDIPDSTAVTSFVSGEGTASRRGRTDIILPRAIPDLSAFHLLGNIDAVIDRLGAGSSTVSFTATGSGSETGDFTLSRANLFASEFDIAFDSIFEMLGLLATMQGYAEEDITIDAVDVTATVLDEYLAYLIDEVRIGVDGAPPTTPEEFEIIVQPGALITIDVDLAGADDDTTQTVSLEVQVPDNAFGSGFLDISGGQSFGFFEECLFQPDLCVTEGEASTAQDFADLIAAGPTNDTVTATLFLDGGPDGPTPQPTVPPPPPAPAPPPAPSEEPPAPQPNPSGAPDPGVQPTPDPIASPDDSSTFAQATPPPTPGDDPAVPGDETGDPSAAVMVDRVVQGFFGVGVFVDDGQCVDCSPFFSRPGGQDRIGTSAAVAYQGFGIADSVVIAPARDYPSALVAAPLAAGLAAPILLSADGAIDPRVSQAIQDLGATSAILVAPDGQLGGTIEADLAAAGITAVDRIGGADRFAVAANVARRLGGTRAWLVEGENADPARGWPDAMSVGPVAAMESAPILLTRSGDLPEATQDVIGELGVTNLTIAGGPNAVSTAVEESIGATVASVDRIAGANRYETSVLLARRALDLGANPFNLWLVTGNAFPDGLSAAPAVANTFGMMLMVDGTDLENSAATAAVLRSLAGTAPSVAFVGGFAAISQDVEVQVYDALVGNSPPVEQAASAEG